MQRLIGRTVALAALAGALLSACGGSAKAPEAPAAPPAAAAPDAAGAQEGEGVEVALVTYADSSQGFSVGYPGTWTQNPAVKDGVQFDGGDDRMRLEFVSAPDPSDPLAYAKSDLAALGGLFPGFKQLGLGASTEVEKAVVLGFEASGTSSVTGKTYTARGDRYYLPMQDGRLAILTVVGPSSHYDSEGVRDIALTLKTIR